MRKNGGGGEEAKSNDNNILGTEGKGIHAHSSASAAVPALASPWYQTAPFTGKLRSGATMPFHRRELAWAIKDEKMSSWSVDLIFKAR